MKLTDPKCCCRGSKKEMFPHTASPINILFETQKAEAKYTTLLSQSQMQARIPLCCAGS